MKTNAIILVVLALLSLAWGEVRAEFRAGAAIVDVTPVQFPVIVNGGMLSRTVETVKTPLNARAIVLDDGKTRLGIVVVDSCMLERPFLDEVKQLASQRTKIATNCMLISATHTHSAPASMSCLGTNLDPTYVPYLREKIAAAIAAAEANLEPAAVGWAVRNAADFTALRRWIRRPDRIAKDPFGNLTVRANMHAGSDWDNVTGESGPEDPDLSLISFQARDGRPIAVLANFSMHYFSGEKGLSADYFGLFSNGLQQRLAPNQDDTHPPFVAIMSHGCSGDIWRRDYRIPAAERENPTIESYTTGLLEIAQAAHDGIEYDHDVDLAMAEHRLELNYRVPDAQRLNWAQGIVDAMGDRPPKDSTEVYAMEQIILHQRQSTEVVVQAIRIGNIGIATTPNETYALTGLKLKLQSPLSTMVIELANGGDGYIPPPEQHFLGGYNTWAARSAGLEIEAEPKITEAALSLLERVAGRSRRGYRGSVGSGVAEAEPMAYWQLDDFAGPFALDSRSGSRNAVYEPGVVFFLAGKQTGPFSQAGSANRAAHFAGGRMRARLADLGEHYSVSMWFWNGMPVDARDVAGWMFSRGRHQAALPVGDHVGIGGSKDGPGKLIFQQNDGTTDPPTHAGVTEIKRWTWNHVALVRNERNVRIFLNGAPQPEIEVEAIKGVTTGLDQLFFGGRCDNRANWEGRLDEIAVFNRPLKRTEIERFAVGK